MRNGEFAWKTIDDASQLESRSASQRVTSLDLGSFRYPFRCSVQAAPIFPHDGLLPDSVQRRLSANASFGQTVRKCTLHTTASLISFLHSRFSRILQVWPASALVPLCRSHQVCHHDDLFYARPRRGIKNKRNDSQAQRSCCKLQTVRGIIISYFA